MVIFSELSIELSIGWSNMVQYGAITLWMLPNGGWRMAYLLISVGGF